MSERFTEILRAASEPAWSDAVRHRFVNELFAGAVPDAVMARYLILPSLGARARARVEAGIQRPWPADKVERWGIDRLIPYAKNARTHTDAQVARNSRFSYPIGGPPRANSPRG